METRIKNKNIRINYQKVQRFFDARSKKYSEKYPYVPTSYQEKNPALASARDLHEKQTILPLLKVNRKSKVLDVGCGVGRWADTLVHSVGEYLGTDFSQPLLDVATKRVTVYSDCVVRFQRLAMQDFINTKADDFLVNPPFCTCIVAGVLIYINDEDLITSLAGLEKIMAPHSLIYFREVVGIEERLTLNQHYSYELEDNYNAIYRTIDDYLHIFEEVFGKKGFTLTHQAKLLTDELSNKKETTQHYFILER